MRQVVIRTGYLSVVVPLIIVANVGVYLLWLVLADDSAFMVDNFLVSYEALNAGRAWTLLTSVFSHNWFLHLFVNMYVLSGFGPVVERREGAQRFLKFYLLSGIIGSLVHCLTSHYLLGRSDLPALGASGAVAGVILFFALTFPREKILLLGLIPMPALVGALVFVGLDVWGLVEQVGGHGLPIGHGAHLGGAATGLIFYFISRREPPRRRIIDVVDAEFDRL